MYQATAGNRPFRFGVNLTTAAPGPRWQALCRRAEELGYDTVHVPDHLGAPAPFPALVAAAAATERVRVGTFVLNAGFWNPALLAREAATCDLLTGGRLELGLGAGYVQAEHDTAGLPFGTPGQRAAHLEHTVREVARLLADPDHEPRPAQRRVPLLVGGNGDRVLRLAAERAAVAAFTGARQAPDGPQGELQLLSPAELEQRVTAYRAFEAARADRTEPAELNHLVQRVVLTDDRRAAAAALLPYAPALTEQDLLEHPALLAGTPHEVAHQLHVFRERFGFSYITVLEPFLEPFGEVVRELRRG
ncbi:TIGR03621 family F420-dependent LLM class oxidoreductase [Streptomyces sp. HNM0574]|uniref:TIGR03621 family F420-dependent LLM class oxidoreductase n=1 Tax=Streptomyces sp. HNM0574 TaxID=2714954 RepID=UPI00146F5F51|nr:TIGR03621 family F420-dependent LLM class oxidoreductase [Streptomyces sp. HNM0574]NLU69865.1 TIGR03621 family F420-dependent LLM class oxidoreductase [Streptomyces sp. HNM0574]